MYLLGENINLGIGVETERGTGVAPAEFIPARTPTGVQPIVERTIIKETKATRSMSQDAITNQVRAEGDLEFNVRNKTIGYILKSLLGKVTSALSGTETAVYNHTFEIDTTTPQNPSLTLAVAKSGFQDYEYPLAVVSSLEIKTPVDDIVNATASFIASKEEAHTDYSVAFSDDDYFFPHYKAKIKIADDVAGLASADLVCVKDFAVAINNNARPDLCLSSQNPVDIIGLLYEITGTLTLNKEDETYHDAWVNNTHKAIEITLERDDITIGISATPKVVITLPKVTLDAPEERPIDDIVTEGVEFTAHYDEAEAGAIKVVVTNELANY